MSSVICAFRLGIHLFEDAIYRGCKQIQDPREVHASVCKGNGGLIARLNDIRDTIFEAAKLANLDARRETQTSVGQQQTETSRCLPAQWLRGGEDEVPRCNGGGSQYEARMAAAQCSLKKRDYQKINLTAMHCCRKVA
eukprot:TRINITY_DN2201_c0_g1_i7.p1 TRINITY_DN2201_c0_g1~~TRINITY_DN2201_c0_g1_i7.p1  ORF type:complete len:138 (+),score=32.11 TRINITY_DN2201_c0_g1_i7:436-849(+)